MWRTDNGGGGKEKVAMFVLGSMERNSPSHRGKEKGVAFPRAYTTNEKDTLAETIVKEGKKKILGRLGNGEGRKGRGDYRRNGSLGGEGKSRSPILHRRTRKRRS